VKRSLLILFFTLSAALFAQSGKALADSMASAGDSMSKLGATIYLANALNTPDFNSLDNAIPSLTDAERDFAISQGYMFTTKPMRWYIGGSPASERIFMNSIGFLSYAKTLEEYENANSTWLAVFLASLGAMTVSTIGWAGSGSSLNSSTSIWPYLSIGTGIVAGVSMYGTLISVLVQPQRPSFNIIALRANQKNRELASQ
jgi:hypothetical protein